MTPQFLIDGIGNGLLIGLGAIGVTLTYKILRFANFAHGEFITIGAYVAWSASLAIAGLFASTAASWEPVSISAALVLGSALAMAAVALLALALDRLLFARLRQQGETIVLVMASFGASMALRSLIEFAFGASPVAFNDELQIALRLPGGLRATPDQLALLCITLLLLALVHVLMTRTQSGRALRAVAENLPLARVIGIDVDRLIALTWILGGALAAATGIMTGLLLQIRPTMGLDLLLPLFAAAILGGIGSVPGAIVGGLVIGLAEAAAVPLVGAEWRGAVAFACLGAILLLRPQGLWGGRP